MFFVSYLVDIILLVKQEEKHLLAHSLSVKEATATVSDLSNNPSVSVQNYYSPISLRRIRKN